jgi:glutathione S-transferase
VGKAAVLGGSLPALRSLLKDLDAMVAGPYLAGENLTLADCAAFPFLWRVDQEFGIGTAGGHGEDDEGQLRPWLDTCLRTTAIERTVPRQGWWWWW